MGIGANGEELESQPSHQIRAFAWAGRRQRSRLHAACPIIWCSATRWGIPTPLMCHRKVALLNVATLISRCRICLVFPITRATLGPWNEAFGTSDLWQAGGHETARRQRPSGAPEG
jgi:hypothetical protein